MSNIVRMSYVIEAYPLVKKDTFAPAKVRGPSKYQISNWLPRRCTVGEIRLRQSCLPSPMMPSSVSRVADAVPHHRHLAPLAREAFICRRTF